MKKDQNKLVTAGIILAIVAITALVMMQPTGQENGNGQGFKADVSATTDIGG